MEIFKVKITKSDPQAWYKDLIGNVYLVSEWDKTYYKVLDGPLGAYYIFVSDCEIIDTSKPALTIENISLRDYFAAKAMQSYLINNAITKNNPNSSYESYFTESEIANYSYNLADTMLKAREVK